MGTLNMKVEKTAEFIKSKFKTVDDCKRVVDINTFESITEDKVVLCINYLQQGLTSDLDIYWSLKESIKELSKLEDLSKKKILLVKVFQECLPVLEELPDYNFYIRFITYLVYRSKVGVN